MLGNLLKKDLKKDMRWLWIIFVVTIAFAGVSRGCRYLSESIAFFKIVGIFFGSIYYSLAVNAVLQPFLRSFINFSKSFYGDEAYLTHTLPVTKNQLINSKFLTSIIEMVLGFICVVLSLFIMYYSPSMFTNLKAFLSLIISGDFSLFWALTLMIILIIVEFLMFISIILFSIIIAYRKKEKRVLNTFLITMGLSFAAISVLSVFLVIVLLINGVELSSSILVLPSKAFISVILTGIIIYSLFITLFYLLAKKEFNKGVDVD